MKKDKDISHIISRILIGSPFVIAGIVILTTFHTLIIPYYMYASHEEEITMLLTFQLSGLSFICIGVAIPIEKEPSEKRYKLKIGLKWTISDWEASEWEEYIKPRRKEKRYIIRRVLIGAPLIIVGITILTCYYTVLSPYYVSQEWVGAISFDESLAIFMVFNLSGIFFIGAGSCIILWPYVGEGGGEPRRWPYFLYSSA